MLLFHAFVFYLLSQSLQALKKISQEHPTACLRAGALMAVLSYLDFFSTGVQVLNFTLAFALRYITSVLLSLDHFSG